MREDGDSDILFADEILVEMGRLKNVLFVNLNINAVHRFAACTLRLCHPLPSPTMLVYHFHLSAVHRNGIAPLASINPAQIVRERKKNVWIRNLL